MPAVSLTNPSEALDMEPGMRPRRVPPRFFVRDVQDNKASKEEGRAIFKRVEFVEVRIPGDKDNVVVRPAHDGDRREFPQRYAAFKAEQDQDTATGTLLSAWGYLNSARVEEYGAGKVRTVEQLSTIPDSNLASFGPFTRKERQAAIDWMDAMTGGAPVAKLRAEIEERDNRIETLERQVKELVEATQAEKRARKGKD